MFGLIFCGWEGKKSEVNGDFSLVKKVQLIFRSKVTKKKEKIIYSNKSKLHKIKISYKWIICF